MDWLGRGECSSCGSDRLCSSWSSCGTPFWMYSFWFPSNFDSVTGELGAWSFFGRLLVLLLEFGILSRVCSGDVGRTIAWAFSWPVCSGSTVVFNLWGLGPGRRFCSFVILFRYDQYSDVSQVLAWQTDLLFKPPVPSLRDWRSFLWHTMRGERNRETRSQRVCSNNRWPAATWLSWENGGWVLFSSYIVTISGALMRGCWRPHANITHDYREDPWGWRVRVVVDDYIITPN